MKTVGKARKRTVQEALDWNASVIRMAPRWTRRRPRGVYRFKTAEDLEQWERTMLETETAMRRRK